MRLPENVSRKLRALPDAPGCYLMRDRQGRIIYVGKAASLRKRVQSYFREATLRRADPKLRGLLKSVHDLDWIVVRNEAEAVLTEGRLIKEYRPRYNVSFRDDKRFLLLRADPREALPRFRLCRIQQSDGALYFGPYASSRAARTTLDFVEKRFGLRKCAPQIPDTSTYQHCLNDVIRFCSAPCIGKVSPAEYGARFGEACAFLRGERPAHLQELREQMEAASAAMDFERAVALRDTLFALQATVRQRVRVAPTPAIERQVGAAGVEALRQLLRLPALPRTIEAYDVSNISGTYAVASMVCSVGGLPQRHRYRHFRIRTVSGSDDAAMMAEVVSRRFDRLLREAQALPDLVLVDGGLPQLHAARHALVRLGLGHVPCAGLAKRREEIYRDEFVRPLRLPADSPALKVLQRIRDEAHRFALTYHRRLRSRVIRESVLDEIPGIGARRKRQLLEHFGSVRRLGRVAEEEIAALPGIGPHLAHAVKLALRPPGVGP
jgi:excinuclease ABC subunit C